MPNLTLAFAQVKAANASEEFSLIDFVDAALTSSAPQRLNAESTTTLAFLDIQRTEIDGRVHVVASYAFAQGEHYQVIDGEHQTIGEADYPIPPFKGRALFIVTPEGIVVIEKKSYSYILPERLIAALAQELRRQANFQFGVDVWPLGLEQSYESMLQFILGLRTLQHITFAKLRHSNPSERSRFMDLAADQRIELIAYESEHPEGIDRSHEEFENQLEHARRYAIIRKAGGQSDDGYRAMAQEDGQLNLTVNAPQVDPENLAKRMVALLLTIVESLRQL